MNIFAALLLSIELLNPHTANQRALNSEYQKFVNEFVAAVKEDDREKVADLVHYPLRRDYPIPEISNKQEMLERYDQVFDEEVTSGVVNSSPALDWEEMGWRGIMLDVTNGSVWIDYDGSVWSVSHDSTSERKLKAQLIEKQKSILYSSLKEFDEPMLVADTENFTIRIDDLGDCNYRYAVWKKGISQSQKPDLILEHGVKVSDGSCGAHHYEFLNGDYHYNLSIFCSGFNGKFGTLEVYSPTEPLYFTENVERAY